MDLVIDPTTEQLERFLALLPQDRYYVSPQRALEALGRRTQFNVIDMAEGGKIDLMILKARAYSRMEFSRRRTFKALGRDLVAASPEDVVLAKLEWNKISPSERQLRDCLSVLRTQGERLDLAYLRTWAEQLEVLETLEDLLKGAG
ncbi:MAG: hypothetical protein U0931_42295 [Vulcanimicrobiota bacterium]